MKKIFLVTTVSIFGLSCLFFKCAAQQKRTANLDEAKKAIEMSNATYFQAFAKGDSALFLAHYTPDCWIMPPNAPAVCGLDAALAFFKAAYHKFGLRNGKLITVDVFGDGVEFVTEVGFWQSFDTNNKVRDNGKFLVIWKKTPDGWKMFRDSFNSDRAVQL
jgi:ketosteroid isomerase-like protein